MITHQFVENIGRRLMAVHAEEKNVAEEMQRMEQTARARLQALRDEAANIDALLDSLNRFDQLSIESFLAGGAPPAAVIDEAPAEVAVPAVPVAAAPAIVDPPAEPIPSPIVVAPAKPEARGLKQSDADILIVMRANREADGICRMSMTQIAKLAGVPQKSAAEQCVKRLRTACIIMPTKEDQTIFHVAEKGQRVPIGGPARAKATPAPTTPPAPTLRPTATEADLDAKVLDLITRAALSGGGQALFNTDVLANKMEVNALRLDRSLTRLAEAGRIVRRKSLPGHVAFEVLQGAEVAA